jgi:hypothetical protein
MRVCWILIGILPAASGVFGATAQQPEPAKQLVRDVVYNEMHDHITHGYWRYWIEKHKQDATRLEEQVETSDGPLNRLMQENGRPLDQHTQREEQARLDHLANSPQEQASHRKAYAEDEKRIGDIFALLPDAFVYEYVDDENGCHHLHFHPDPTYAPHSIQSRIFHAMSGELWIDARLSRLVQLDGRLDENVDFGYGLLGRIYKGGWFRLQRTQVSPTEWKTEQLEIHMSGRAMLFNTIARETSEIRGGFAAIPARLSLAQGMALLEQADPHLPPHTIARVSPASFPSHR